MVRRVLIGVAILVACTAKADETVALKTATGHPMKYYVALPSGWTPQKRWPVVVVIESANRQFENAAQVFTKARGDLPFIILVPMVTTNGGTNYRQATGYRYDEKEWNEIEGIGRCQFDLDGIAAVAADAQKRYSAEPKFFITGFEAGGHTLWAVLLRQPAALRAVAPVETNYAGRCLEDGQFATSVPDLPVRLFSGGNEGGGRAGFLGSQTQRAREAAEQHGFRNFSEQIVPGRGHEPLADAVLAYFFSLWKK